MLGMDQTETISELSRIILTHIPLVDNPWISPAVENLTKQKLIKYRLHTVDYLFANSHPGTVSDMIANDAGTHMDCFILHRVRTALLGVLADPKEEPPALPPLTLIIHSADNTHLVSRLYHLTQTLQSPGGLKVRRAWETDTGEVIPDDVWNYCCSQTRFVSSNYRHKLLHYKYIHRIYLTPVFLHKIHPEASETCPKCKVEGADFAHLTWNCGVIQKYWDTVFRSLSLMVEQSLHPTPLLALLGYVKPLTKK